MDPRPPPSDRIARLFIGLWPDPETRAALVRHQAAWRWPVGAHPTRPERLHLTLHFLGELPRERIAALVQALALPCEPFELALDQPELWSGVNAVVRPTTVPPALAALHGRLLRVLEALGQPSLRPRFEPHVTLARGARGALPPSAMVPLRWAVAGYALVESDLRPPACYRRLADYP
jgi:2'-5' RNA ligase